MAIPFSLGSLPANLKKMEQYLDIASDYESIDFAVSYWCMHFESMVFIPALTSILFSLFRSIVRSSTRFYPSKRKRRPRLFA